MKLTKNVFGHFQLDLEPEELTTILKGMCKAQGKTKALTPYQRLAMKIESKMEELEEAAK